MAAASTLHFCLAILWRIEAFSLKCPGKRAAINLVEKKTQHLISSIGYTLSLSLEKHLNAEIYAGNILFSVAKQMSFTFITEGVQGVDHELEDAVPHQ